MRNNSQSSARTIELRSAKTWLQFAILCILALAAMPSRAQTIISSVDTSLVGSQKYVLRVGGQPYFMNSIYVPCDKLRYTSTYLWTMANCSTLVGQVAADGFNTVTVPVSWWEVEPTQGTFDWTVLEAYLTMVNQAGLKMELEWLGSNSTGGIGWEGDSANPVHLRTPDYVLYAASYGATTTTSTYTIDSSHAYTLDCNDTNLVAREQYVLGQVMAHIATWDAANGARHPVIGVQVENEFNDPEHSSPAESVAFLDGIAQAVKQSNYIVWTRANTVHSSTTFPHRVAQNESLRSTTGTYLDFIGEDDYSTSVTEIEADVPVTGKNFPMIMENGGQSPFMVKLAALAGNEAMNTVDMCGSTTEGMYLQSSQGACTTAATSYVPNVVANTKMLGSDPVDLALNAQGQGLFVHNWNNTGTATTGGTLGITYTPTGTTDVGISIQRSDSEMILMSTQGGTFTIPASYGINSATKGYFNSNNVWVSQGSVAYTSTSVTPAAFTAVRLKYLFPGSSAITVQNSSFETPATSTYVYNPSGSYWTFSGASPSGSGVAKNGSTISSGNANAPDGTQTAFLEETGTISQTFGGFITGNSYTIYFMASQRQTVGSGTQVGQTFNLQINGTTIASFAPPQNSAAYTQYYATFTATATTQTVSFVGTNLYGGDNTALIDLVQIK